MKAGVASAALRACSLGVYLRAPKTSFMSMRILQSGMAQDRVDSRNPAIRVAALQKP